MCGDHLCIVVGEEGFDYTILSRLQNDALTDYIHFKIREGNPTLVGTNMEEVQEDLWASKDCLFQKTLDSNALEATSVDDIKFAGMTRRTAELLQR